MAARIARAHATVVAAVRGGGVARLDSRGLMPLSDARALLAKATSFHKGRGRMAAGVYVLDSDRSWAALLSLKDGAELVRVATDISWKFQPRGMENIDLVLRYGGAIVPWLATRLDDAGVLHNTPWCVVPCLLALDTDAAFELVWSTKAVAGTPMDLATAWLDRHPKAGISALTRRARAGDPRAKAYLRGASCEGGARMRSVRAAARALPRAASRALLQDLGLAGPLSVGAILSLFDAAAGPALGSQLQRWPRFVTRVRGLEYHALRLLAAREREGDGWGVMFERIEGVPGDGEYPPHAAQYAIGSQVPGGVALRSRALGPVTRSALRAARQSTGHALWGDARRVAAGLGLDPPFDVLVDTVAFAHAVTEPSASPTYASLADALVSRDASRFVPGRSNLDPRLH